MEGTRALAWRLQPVSQALRERQALKLAKQIQPRIWRFLRVRKTQAALMSSEIRVVRGVPVEISQAALVGEASSLLACLDVNLPWPFLKFLACLPSGQRGQPARATKQRFLLCPFPLFSENTSRRAWMLLAPLSCFALQSLKATNASAWHGWLRGQSHAKRLPVSCWMDFACGEEGNHASFERGAVLANLERSCPWPS